MKGFSPLIIFYSYSSLLVDWRKDNFKEKHLRSRNSDTEDKSDIRFYAIT